MYPPDWKTANCVVIPKKGKANYNDPKSYRPISLLPCLGKLLQTITAKRLALLAATQTGATHPYQMGAMSDNSAIDALLRTITPIANTISIGRKTSKTIPRLAVLTHEIEGACHGSRSDHICC